MKKTKKDEEIDRRFWGLMVGFLIYTCSLMFLVKGICVRAVWVITLSGIVFGGFFAVWTYILSEVAKYEPRE